MITSIERCKQKIVFGSRDNVIAKIKVNAGLEPPRVLRGSLRGSLRASLMGTPPEKSVTSFLALTRRGHGGTSAIARPTD